MEKIGDRVKLSTLVFDLETIPDVAAIRKVYGGDAHLSDEEIVETFVKTHNKDRDFMPVHLHQVVAIGCVLRYQQLNGQPMLRIGSLGTETSTEKELITAFYNLIDKYSPQLVSWNGNSFDIPVLQHRALIQSVQAHNFWDLVPTDRKWNNYVNRYHERHLDLMEVLGRFNQRAPLDVMAKMCGFAGKLGVDGSQVWNYYKAGRIAEIRAYCETDVVNTHFLLNRFNYMRGHLNDAQLQSENDFVRDELNQLLIAGKTHWQEFLEACS
jgi:predicted PolB exonuclease-like 3'-5' exonuclease